jgi:phenylpropionate dioxygenase-like ring-hydroxylating dioxygenase large terminal subunit
MTLSPYQHGQAIRMIDKAIAHAENGTTDWAESVYRVPVEDYLSERRWREEMDATFMRLPLLLAFTCEMPRPGDYKTMRVLDIPVLMVRGRDERMRAFMNVCTHRGATLAGRSHGNCARFVCPYHAWTFNDQGVLMGVADPAKFGDIDTAERHLKELPCEERAGLIFVGLTPGRGFDLERYLGGMLAEVESFGLETWHMHHQNRLESANWKITHDGYLETYHIPFLHGKTLWTPGAAPSVVMVYEAFGEHAFGPHQRMSGTGRGGDILALKSVPKSEWTRDEYFHAVRTIFPNISIAMSNSGGMISQLFPISPDRCITIQNHLYPHAPANDKEQEDYDGRVDLLIRAVRDEDYKTGFDIQAGLASGANRDFLFGRNEIGPQRWHTAVDHYVDEARREAAAPAHRIAAE